MEEGGVWGGAKRRPSTNRRAVGGVTVARPIRLPRLCEGRSFGRRRSSGRSREAALDQSACSGCGDRHSANPGPRQEERGPRDVTTPPGQSRGLPPVLASERDEERLCAPKPASERGRVARRRHPSSEAGGIIIGAVCAFVRVGSGSGGLVCVVLLSFSAGSPVVLESVCAQRVFSHQPSPCRLRSLGSSGSCWGSSSAPRTWSLKTARGGQVQDRSQ